MKPTFKFSWKQYWAPTPKNIRKWADALLVTFFFGGAAIPDPSTSKTVIAIGLLLKLISNLFKDAEDYSNSPDSSPDSGKLQ